MSDITSWRELVKEAEKLGYTVESFRGTEALVNYNNCSPLTFTKEGNIEEGGQYIAEGRSYNQMYQIMFALD